MIDNLKNMADDQMSLPIMKPVITQINNWEEKLKETIDGDWELIELNPGKPYRSGMKNVLFIQMKVMLEKQITLAKDEERKRIVEILEQSKRSGGDVTTTMLFNGEVDELINKLQ
jgi:hypothetical protein